MTPQTQHKNAVRNVAVLIAAQAILGSQLPMLFVMGGLVGNSLASNPCLATLPISLIMFGSMTTAPWISPLMQRHGRRAGFIVGALGGASGAAVAAFALYTGSFALLLVGSYLSGIYFSAQGFYRFAATDAASPAFRPKAISFVMAGGLLSAVVGPQLNNAVMDLFVVPFLASYLVIVALNLCGLFLFFGLKRTYAAEPDAAHPVAPPRSRKELLAIPQVTVAIICAMVAYALMNLVMTSTPLAVVGCGFTARDANDIVSAHVLAMFIPSFFTGHLIARFGAERIIATGLVILAVSGGIGLSGVALGNFYVALTLLGIGWNFGFIGATTMLTSAHAPNERGVIQGFNDALVFGCVTLASLASGGLMNCAGGDAVEGWNAVNMAMIPFLTLAGGALIWLMLGNRKARQA
ncbi:MAG: MFS transporter [Litoreibacter sp.]|nr:MFS transporter [Litoreibacter sp.]